MPRWSGTARVLLRVGWMLLISLAPGTSRGQDPPAGGPAPQPGGWQLGLRGSEGWDSNARLLPGVTSPSLVHRLDLSLGYQRTRPRSSLSLDGSGGGFKYQSAGPDDQFVYTFAGDTWLQTSASTRLALSHSMGATYSQEIPFLVEEGLPIQLTRSRSSTTRAGLTRQLGPRGNLALSARRVAISFDDPTLVDGSVLSAEIRGERSLGPGDNLGGAYIWQRSDRPDDNRTSHSLLVGWRGRLGEHSRGVVELGVVGYDGEDTEAGIRAAPRGELSLERLLNQGALSFRYARLVTQAFGTGRDRLADLVSLTFAKTIRPSLTLNSSLSYSYSKDPADPGFQFHTQLHRLSAVYRLSRSTSVEAGYGFFSRRPRMGPAASRHLVSVLISSNWRFQ